MPVSACQRSKACAKRLVHVARPPCEANAESNVEKSTLGATGSPTPPGSDSPSGTKLQVSVRTVPMEPDQRPLTRKSGPKNAWVRIATKVLIASMYAGSVPAAKHTISGASGGRGAGLTHP